MGNIVAIVGRPNVGKSTLFNRLTQTRRAIVNEESGTTRDRQYGKAEWGGKEFSVIDTGGWISRSGDTFEDEITNVILRITDLMGGKKINIADTHPWVETYEYTELNYFFRNTKPTEEYDGKLANWLNEAMAACLLSSEKDTDYGLALL